MTTPITHLPFRMASLLYLSEGKLSERVPHRRRSVKRLLKACHGIKVGTSEAPSTKAQVHPCHSLAIAAAADPR